MDLWPAAERVRIRPGLEALTEEVVRCREARPRRALVPEHGAHSALQRTLAASQNFVEELGSLRNAISVQQRLAPVIVRRAVLYDVSLLGGLIIYTSSFFFGSLSRSLFWGFYLFVCLHSLVALIFYRAAVLCVGV